MWGGLEPARDFSPASEARSNLWVGVLKSRRRLKRGSRHSASVSIRGQIAVFFGVFSAFEFGFWATYGHG